MAKLPALLLASAARTSRQVRFSSALKHKQKEQPPSDEDGCISLAPAR
jgi:hypothetical protein